jgi:hypothetical protein
MKSHSPGPALVAASVIAAGLCTLVVDHGWLVWLHVLAALVVVATLAARLKV